MQPIKHPLCNTALGPPPGMTEEQCGTLPIRRDIAGVHSFWHLSPADLQALAAGGCVCLSIVGNTHPPLSLQVLKPDQPHPAG